MVVHGGALPEVQCTWPRRYGQLMASWSTQLSSRCRGGALRLLPSPARRPDAHAVAAPWQRRCECGEHVHYDGVHGLGGGLSKGTHRVVLGGVRWWCGGEALPNGGSRVVGVGARGGAPSSGDRCLRAPCSPPSSRFPSRPSSLGVVRAVGPPNGGGELRNP